MYGHHSIVYIALLDGDPEKKIVSVVSLSYFF